MCCLVTTLHFKLIRIHSKQKNSIRSILASTAFAEVLHWSRNTCTTNCRLCGSGERNEAHKRAKVNYNRTMMQELEQLQWAKRHISEQSNFKQWRKFKLESLSSYACWRYWLVVVSKSVDQSISRKLIIRAFLSWGIPTQTVQSIGIIVINSKETRVVTYSTPADILVAI